jgi:hypothetical protein
MKNKKLIGGIAGLLLLVILYAAFGRGGISASDVIKRTEKEVALVQPWLNLSVEKIDADTDNNAIIYNGVSVNSTKIPDLVIKIEKIVESGVDDDSYAGNPGDITTIKNLDYNNITLTVNGQQILTAAKYTQENLALNYKGLLKVLAENATVADPAEISEKMLPLYKDYSIGRVHVEDIKINVSYGMSGSIKEIEGKDITLTRYGAGSMTGLQLSLMGQKIFELDKFNYASASLPAFLAEIMTNPKTYTDNPEAFAEKIGQDPLVALSPFEFRDFNFSGLVIDTPNGPVSLKQLKGDFSLIDGNLHFACALDDLLLSRNLISTISYLEPFVDIIKSDLHLNADWDMLIAGKNDPVDVTVHSILKEQVLGGFSTDVSIDMPKARFYEGGSYYDGDADPRHIKNVAVSIEDTGIIDTLFAFKAVMEGSTLEASKQEALDEFRANIANSADYSPIEQKLFGAFINLLENGGSIDIAFKPENPVAFDEVETVKDEALSITYKSR